MRCGHLSEFFDHLFITSINGLNMLLLLFLSHYVACAYVMCLITNLLTYLLTVHGNIYQLHDYIIFMVQH